MKIVKPTKRAKNWGAPWLNIKQTDYDWSKGILIGMDTETTSKYPHEARPVSVGIVLDDPTDNENREWSWICDPGCDVPLDAVAIHGLSTEYVREYGESESFVIQAMLDVLTSLWQQYQVPNVMVNCAYDLTLIRQRMIANGLGKLEDFDLPPVLDTLTIDRKIDPYRRGRRTLTATAAAYNTTISGAHTAIGDVKCSIKLARKIAEKYPFIATADLAELQKMQKAAHNEWLIQYEKYRQIDDSGFTIGAFGWPFQIYENETS